MVNETEFDFLSNAFEGSGNAFESSGNAFTIILSPNLTTETKYPARRNTNRRIQKKWLRKYGYRKIPDTSVYFTIDGKAVMHPATYKKLKRAIGEDEVAKRLEAAANERGLRK